MYEVLGYLAPTLAAVVGIGLSALLVLGLKKLGFDVSEAEAAKIRSEVADVVMAVEEVAKSQEAATTVKVSGAEKLARAIAKIRIKFPHISAGHAEDMVHSVIGQVGLGASLKAKMAGLKVGF